MIILPCFIILYFNFVNALGKFFCVERIGLTEINLAAFVLSSSPVPRGGALHIL